GWSSKNGSKWKTMPDQMFVYRAAAFWQRAYAPDLGMGLQTQEEIHDVYDAGRGANGEFSVDIEALRTAERTVEAAASKGAAVELKPGEHLDMITGEVVSLSAAVDKYEEVLSTYGEKEAENFYTPEIGAELERRQRKGAASKQKT